MKRPACTACHFWNCGVLFEPRDLWVGVYWKRYICAIELYICLVPMLPIRLYYQWYWRGLRP